MELLWTDSKLSRLPPALRAKLKFYAPLVDSLHFFGIDPVAFTRAGASVALWRDGAEHDVAANVPRFEYTDGLPDGVLLESGETLEWSPQNNLDDAGTLIWFEDGVPMSTPGSDNPIDSNGIWTGNLDVHVKHLVKASSVLANEEINLIQMVLEDVAEEIPEPPAPPVGDPGTFVSEVPSGSRNGSNVTFTLSQDPDPDSMILFCFGGVVELVASSPGELEFTLSGTGDRTITMGLAPNTGYPFRAHYVIA